MSGRRAFGFVEEEGESSSSSTSSSSSSLGESMEVERPAAAAAKVSSCSICLEAVLDQGQRSIAKLPCGHDFHLDCIGSAFNAKGAMQCPNCRKVEKGRWLYANGHLLSAEFDFESAVAPDLYDLSYPGLPLEVQWCPIGEFIQVTPYLEEGESQQNTYNETAAFGDHSNASSSSSTHMCPYLALNAPPTVHSAPSSNNTDSAPTENNPFQHHHHHLHTTIVGGQSSADMMNPHGSATDIRSHHEWVHRENASHLGTRLSRNNDPRNQQRLGSFVHPNSLSQGSRGGSNVFTQPTGGEGRASYSRRGYGTHIYQSSPFAPLGRVNPSGINVTSATSSATEIGGDYYGVAAPDAHRNNQESNESLSRRMDGVYGWEGRQGFSPLPWIPMEGESQWWGPFNPDPRSPPPQSGSFPQNRPENGYQRMPPH